MAPSSRKCKPAARSSSLTSMPFRNSKFKAATCRPSTATPNVVNVTSKSGSNQFHGSAFEFLRNSSFDARNFFYVPPIGSTQSIEPYRRNQYGFAVGGPIRRDKTFFFAD